MTPRRRLCRSSLIRPKSRFWRQSPNKRWKPLQPILATKHLMHKRLNSQAQQADNRVYRPDAHHAADPDALTAARRG